MTNRTRRKRGRMIPVCPSTDRQLLGPPPGPGLSLEDEATGQSTPGGAVLGPDKPPQRSPCWSSPGHLQNHGSAAGSLLCTQTARTELLSHGHPAWFRSHSIEAGARTTGVRGLRSHCIDHVHLPELRAPGNQRRLPLPMPSPQTPGDTETVLSV